MAAAALSVLYVVLGAFDEWYVLIIGIPSLALIVLGAWYAISRSGTVRILVVALAVVGLIAFIIVMIASQTIRVLVISGALALLSIAAAGYALPAPGRKTEGPAVLRARHPVLIMNLKSGGGKAERFHLVDECRERGIEPIVLTPGTDLLELAENAVARGADVIGMAGGDGSQALVASVASRYGIPHVVIPAGTRNHFALDLGLDRDDVVGALDAYSEGVERTIDLAEVNGRVFVNNASMGVYAKIVQSGDYRDAKLHTAAAMLPDLLGPEATPLDLRFTLPSGQEAKSAQLLLVSNNPYALARLRGGGTRERLDRGVLGIAFLRVDSAGQAEKLAALEASGRVQRFSTWSEWTASEFEVRSSHPVEVGVDGEALTLQPPLRFVTRPGALTIRLPRSAPGRSPAARTVRVMTRPTVVALWLTVLGRPTGSR